MSRCECALCQRNRAAVSFLEAMPAYMRSFWEDLYFHLEHVEGDLDWHKAIAEGSWPSSVEILKGWLYTAKKAAKGSRKATNQGEPNEPASKTHGSK